MIILSDLRINLFFQLVTEDGWIRKSSGGSFSFFVFFTGGQPQRHTPTSFTCIQGVIIRINYYSNISVIISGRHSRSVSTTTALKKSPFEALELKFAQTCSLRLENGNSM